MDDPFLDFSSYLKNIWTILQDEWRRSTAVHFSGGVAITPIPRLG